jgi:hypothetical protein
VSGISPSSGPAKGGTVVAITGTALANATAADFGKVAGTNVIVNSATSVTVTAPAGKGTVDIVVVTAGGKSATSSADQFTHTARRHPCRHDPARPGPHPGGERENTCAAALGRPGPERMCRPTRPTG